MGLDPLVHQRGRSHDHKLRQVVRHLFVHAGIRPGVALQDQTEEDLIWIREPFLHHPTVFGKPVIYGHSPRPRFDPMHDDKIGVDSVAGDGVGDGVTGERIPQQQCPPTTGPRFNKTVDNLSVLRSNLP